MNNDPRHTACRRGEYGFLFSVSVSGSPATMLAIGLHGKKSDPLQHAFERTLVAHLRVIDARHVAWEPEKGNPYWRCAVRWKNAG